MSLFQKLEKFRSVEPDTDELLKILNQIDPVEVRLTKGLISQPWSFRTMAHVSYVFVCVFSFKIILIT